MDQYDTSQLTEFPRFEPESSQSGVSTFFNKFWKFPIFSPGDTDENSQNKALTDSKVESPQTDDANKPEYDEKPEPAYAVELEGRSFQNVLRRISSLVALGSSASGTKYSDTELARYWMPDDISRECYECAARFGALRRRHHCRVCGQVFCSRCCSQRVPGQIFGCAGGLRVCNYCCNVVLGYLRENDAAETPDLRSLQDNLQQKFPDNKGRSCGGAGTRDNYMFAREEPPAAHAHGTRGTHGTHGTRGTHGTHAAPREPAADLFPALLRALPLHQHRYRLVRYSGVWRGSDVIQWLVDNTNHKTRAQARQVCQAWLAGGWLAAVAEGGVFADYALYRPAPRPESPSPPPPPHAAPPQHPHPHLTPDEQHTRLVESVSSYCLDLDLGESSARLTKTPRPPEPEPKSSPSSEEDHPNTENTEDAGPCRGVAAAGEEHLQRLLRQWLCAESLSAAWLPVLYPLCVEAAARTAPHMHSSDIDVRNYVQVKKLRDGVPRDSRVVPGVVLTKNVAHRGMPQEIDNPTVLLLDCSIAYQRVEGKLTSLEPVLLQEREYLARCAARITALRPAVVLCRGAVSRGVQDALRGAGVALAAGVGERALARAARCLRADRVASVDARVAVPRLGECRRFAVTTYPSKTLMSLEGCAEPALGCCVLLRGAPPAELARVKRVVKFMLLACYSWRRERAFLADVGALLPEPGGFDDDDDDDDGDHEGAVKDAHDILNEDDDIKDEDDVKDADDIVKDDGGVLADSDNIQKGTDEAPEKANREKFDEDKYKTNSEDDVKVSEASATAPGPTAGAEVPDPLPGSGDDPAGERHSCGVPIRDNSDPLRARAAADDVVPPPASAPAPALQAHAHHDRWSTDDAVLCISPNVQIPAPYLETEAGRRCALRRYFPRPLLRAPPPTPAAPATPRLRRASRARHSVVELQEQHPFVSEPLRAPADAAAVRAALAHYRAQGCRLQDAHRPECPLYAPSVVKRVAPGPEPAPEPEPAAERDPLSPAHHQQLAVLLYSYSQKSANVPDFCVNPWIVTMEMYGRHDITLGAFLDKYCFNSEYKCPASSCSVPVNQHVRRFVHGDACITVTYNEIGHSAADKPKEEQNKQVMFWSRCEQCGAAGRARRLSRAALCLSLAVYLRMRASSAGAARPRSLRGRACRHPLLAHAHFFVRDTAAACVIRYMKITPYEIELPPEVITTRYDTKAMRDALIAQLNDLVLKGHESLSAAAEAGAGAEEYAAFRRHTDQISLALSHARPAETDDVASTAGTVRALWQVSDLLTAAERLLRDAQDSWAASRPARAADAALEEKSDLEESTGENENSGTTYVFGEAAPAPTPREDKEHAAGGEEDEVLGDKKTVRQILSQLLSNKEASHQNGIIISGGLVPVAVRAGEVGSVVAATLASVTYQRSLRDQALRHSNQPEGEEAEGAGRERERSDTERGKAKSNDHIEVLLKEGLLCRVYFAGQFHRLRHALLGGLAGRAAGEDARCCDDAPNRDKDRSLCDIEEGFIRSLAHCVPWAARGGKSGSTFCKTKDDRYVLKEMTKPEWQQFLEFAPHYFSYVSSCRSQRQPSLLARILGVYSVGGAGNGVLVMENVWYGHDHSACTRFDLKGSSRHRLASVAPLAVLLDENLLQLRWQQQLFVASHTGSVLFSCVDRDSEFLAANSVMDYSLLLGIDGHKLVLGIIDYIRTFTWDKKLEHLVKKNLGSGQPTVVSPDEYKRRFRTAARKYFLRCPAPWDHLM